METINDRIVKALKFAGKKQADFIRFSGLAPSSVSMLCSGKNNPSIQTKRDICNFCKVRMEWLETGELPMEAELTKGAVLARQLDEAGVDLAPIGREQFKERIDMLTDEEYIALANAVRKLFL